MRIDSVVLSVGDGPDLSRKLNCGFGDNNRRGSKNRCLLEAKTWSAHGSKPGERERRLIIRPHSKAAGPTGIDAVTLGDEAF